MTVIQKVLKNIKTELWWTVTVLVMVTMVVNVTSLSGPNVCMVKQKYNITKRVKYRAPMSIRTYEWCFAMPPRCSKWNTEMRDVTRLETEERTAEMAVCCPGYKLKDVSCVPTCPSGKTGQGCSEVCPPNKWGPSCAHDCKKCDHGSCDALTGECRCQDGWQGESCETSMTTTAAAAMMEQLLTTETSSTKTTTQNTPTVMTKSSKVTTTVNKISNTESPTTINTTTSTSTTTPKSTLTMASTLTSTEVIETKIVTLPTSIATIPTTKKVEEITPASTSPNIGVMYSNVSLSTVPLSTLNTYTILSDVAKNTKTVIENDSIYNRTEIPLETAKTVPILKTVISTEPTNTKKNKEMTTKSTTDIPQNKVTTVYQISNTNSSAALTTVTTTKAVAKKLPTTVKQPMTTKLKPKEIWIKPAQKGESSIIESKLKPVQELPHTKFKHREVIETTTPKTIIVSIIPTSVTYVTFKKIAFTTSSSMAQKSNHSITDTSNRTAEQESTKSMIKSTTSTPFTVKVLTRANTSSTNSSSLRHNVTKTISYMSSTRGTPKTTPTTKTTNSMSSTLNVSNKRLNSSLLTTVSSFVTNETSSTRKQHPLSEPANKTFVTAPSKSNSLPVTEKVSTELTVQKQSVTIVQRNVTKRITEQPNVTKTFVQMQAEINSKRNSTNSNTVTDDPSKDEETFHILTEPEHITAVMGDKEDEKSTINLISVISIAGGIMMVVITVAVVIVMLERCRNPRYEDARKYNDIRMKVLIDNNDVPPPYVRSIFHTPLPDPPAAEKCHYQPISTLDRNLKQFMRPVVVQTISPLMLENFRGILECHYDHLPRRSQDMGTIQTRSSVAPSVDEREELLPPPRIHSLTDSDIEAMKCEAKLDVIDNTTSEPLYAEIPCWRPPSAHAIEVDNLNDEAVTEL